MSRKKSKPIVPVFVPPNVETPAEPPQASGERRPLKGRTVTRVNRKLVLLTAGAVVLCGACVHGLHAFMVDRSAGGILARADAAESRGDEQEATKLLSQYLQFRPDDIDALQRFALLLHRPENPQRVTQRVYSALEEVLRKDPSRSELRKPLSEAAIGLGRFSDAEFHLDELLKTRADDAALVRLKAQARAGDARPAAKREAAELYVAAIGLDAKSVESYAELAALLEQYDEALPFWSADEGRFLVEAIQPGSEDVRPSNPVESNARRDAWTAANDAELLKFFPAERGATTAAAAASHVLDQMVLRAEPTWKAQQSRARHRYATSDVAGAVADVRLALQSSEASADSEFLVLAATVELAAATQARGDDADRAAAENRDAAIALATDGLAVENPDPTLYGLLAEAELAGGISTESLIAAEKRLRDGLTFVESRREDANAVESRRFDAAALQLRLSLASLLITRGENDPARSNATESAVAEAVAEQVRLLREAGCRPQLIALIEARTATLQRHWDRAAAALEALRPQLIGTPELTRQVDQLLGSCYVQLRNPDRRVEVFKRATAGDPEWTQGRLALAEALLATGRLDEALGEYAQLKSTDGVARTIATLTLRKELRKPAADRDFTAAETALDEFRKAAPDDPAVATLELDVQLACKDFDAADQRAAALQAVAPDAPECWRTWFHIALARQDRPLEDRLTTARERLAEGERRFPDAVEVRLARVELARVGDGALPDGILVEAADNDESLSDDDRLRLYQGLIQSASRAGDKAAVLSLWHKVVAKRPEDLAAWIAIAQTAAELDRNDEVDAAMTAVRRIEGAHGPNGDFVAAVRLLANLKNEAGDVAERDRKSRLDEARALLARAAQQRTYWAAIPRALGMLELLAGRNDAAFEQFQKARELGDSSLEVLRGMVSHYGRQNRWDLAATVLDDAERDVPGLFRNAEAARLKSAVAVQRGNVDEALAVMQSLDRKSAGIEDRISRADLMDARYRQLPNDEKSNDEGKASLAAATAEFRSITDDFSTDPRAWLGLVGHLTRTGLVEQARDAIANAETALPTTPAVPRLRCLALCHRAIDETNRGIELMKQAVAAAPDDAGLRLEAATFFAVSNDFKETQRHLDWLLDPANDVPAATFARARRLRAVATATTGRYEDLVEAVHSLGATAGGIEMPVDDLRAQVALLARRQSLTDRRELIRLLETIRNRAALSPETTFTSAEKFALAALYQQTNQWAKARPLIEELLNDQLANTDYRTALLVGSLRDPVLAVSDSRLEADLRPHLERLQSLEPGTLRLALTTAEFEYRFQHDAEASQCLTDYAASFTQADGRGGEDVAAEELAELRVMAGKAEELRILTVAESCFQLLASRSTNPNDGLLPAMFLGRQGRYDEALSLVENRRPGTSLEAAALVAVSIVSAGTPSPAHYARAEAVVNEALQEAPTSTRAMGLLAGLRMAQGRYDESEATYRRILAENPADVSVLNNLAWLLVVTGKDPKAAETFINEALAIAGPIPDLVDTQGVILLSLRRAEEAARVLRDEFENSPTPRPVMGFHLATACMALDQPEQARETLAKAQKLGLGLEMLHATEHDAYRELVRRLGAER